MSKDKKTEIEVPAILIAKESIKGLNQVPALEKSGGNISGSNFKTAGIPVLILSKSKRPITAKEENTNIKIMRTLKNCFFQVLLSTSKILLNLSI